MKYNVTLNRIANVYYNLGLERAKLHDLSGAAELLKKSLHFSKYQTDARNLLGLIYYEMGETADALIQWVISMNLQPASNRADYYLEEVQRKPGQLELASQMVKKFNQALWQAQHEGEDLAILQLNRIIDEKPYFVKAHILLSLLYMQKEDHVRAGRSLMKVLKIDRNNPKALILMDEVKRRTGRAEIEQNKLKNAFSHRQMSDDDVILPQIKAQATAGQVVRYLSVGLCLGLISFWLLLLPSIRRKINVQANQQVITYSQELSDKNASLTELQTNYDALQESYNDVSTRLAAFEQQNADFLGLYQKLSSIRSNYQSGNLTQAVTDYISIDRSQVTEEPLLSLMNEITQYMQNEGYDTLTSLGTSAWNGGNTAQAEAYFDQAISIRPDEPEALYLKARILQTNGQTAEANAIFDRIVGEHPESSYAERAQTARGY
ncbi:MAG: tetratricopeptide repeat protein [Eubacteriales bacterium]|nr:tetratricopeptide repeat protein [Eubacteriales bacterium]